MTRDADNRTTEKLMREFVSVACECEVRDYLIAEYAERIEQAIAATLGEPIIKCRDCRYYHDGTSNGRRYAEPHCLAIGELAYGALFEVHENDFCSWAERREP